MMEGKEKMEEFRFSLRYKQCAKGNIIIEKLEVKGHTAEEVEEGMNKLAAIAIDRIAKTYKDEENLMLLNAFKKATSVLELKEE